MSFQKNIESLANQFVQQVLAAVRSSSLEDVAAGLSARGLGTITTHTRVSAESASAAKAPKAPRGKGSKSRLGRRTAVDISATLDRIVAVLKDNPSGMRAEEIRSAVGLDSREMPRPMQEGLASKRLHKKGQKRATTYFAATVTGGTNNSKKKG